MQLSNLKVQPTWYFIFGPPQKSSLAQQFATEHKLLHIHLKHIHQDTFKEHLHTGLVVECSAADFRHVQPLKSEILVIVLEGQLPAEEIQIKRDYERIGRCVSLKSANYKLFRKEVYPKLIVVFGPNKAQIQFLCESYFTYTGFNIINDVITANELISKLPKEANYILLGFVPHPHQLTILEQFFNVQVIHLKHQRTQLSNHQEFFNLQAKIVPEISKKHYFHSIVGNTDPAELGAKIGENILPELIFVNVSDEEQRTGVTDYVRKNDGLLLNINEIQAVYKRKPIALKSGIEKLEDLVTIIFRNSNRKQIFFTDYPEKPEEFFILKDKTRSFSLFADALRSQKYEYSKQLNPAIYFLESHKRKHIDLQFSFEKQISSPIKYLVVSGPPCVGKTSAAKYISASFGYKHIQYEAYVASIKEKLIAPEDGEQLPFHKIIKHFSSLIANSGDSPLLIDGFNIDLKDIDNWVKSNGPPTVFNLKTDEKELIRRTRRKNQADVNAEVTEQEALKTKEVIAKNSDWADQLSAKCPSATLFQIDFTPQLILAEKLLDQILKPRVFLFQQNNTLLCQNIAVKYDLGYFDLKKQSLKDIAVSIRKGSYRNVLLSNYNQENDHLVSQDFHQIQKHIGTIRYLGLVTSQSVEPHREFLQLEAPVKVEKPKVEGEEGGQAPPAQEEGEAKKKAFNIYDYTWTKTGRPNNTSQWFFTIKKVIRRQQNSVPDCFAKFQQVLSAIAEAKELAIYESIVV